MPQWDFLNFLAAKARQLPSFDLRMQNRGRRPDRRGRSHRGVKAQHPRRTSEIRADLVIGCDGRNSVTREAAHFAVHEFGVPIDVLWFRISRHGRDPEQVLGNVDYGKVLILIHRGDYFQAGMVIRKGAVR